MTFTGYNLDNLPDITITELDRIRLDFIHEWRSSSKESFYIWHRDYKDEPANKNPYRHKNVIVVTPKGQNFPPKSYTIYVPFIYTGVPIVVCK